VATDDLFNVQGTTATTNLDLGAGERRASYCFIGPANVGLGSDGRPC
jgi:hypothetical protein